MGRWAWEIIKPEQKKKERKIHQTSLWNKMLANKNIFVYLYSILLNFPDALINMIIEYGKEVKSKISKGVLINWINYIL